METSLRIVLLLVAGGIVAGIIWDLCCSKRKNEAKPSLPVSKSKTSTQKSTPKEQSFKKNPFSKVDDFAPEGLDDPFDDVILVKTKINNKYENSKAKEEELCFNDINDTNADNINEHSIASEAYEAETSEGEQDFQLHSLKKNVTLEKNEPKQNPNEAEAVQNSQVNGYAQDLVILNVMARKPGMFLGKKLVEAFQETSVYFGEMNIFHRHENTDGSGYVVFSIASAVEPGMFEISKIDTCITPGITLFFHAEGRNQSIAAFELMLRTAKQIAMRLDAELRDDEHKFVSLHTIEKYRERMRQVAVRQHTQYSQ